MIKMKSILMAFMILTLLMVGAGSAFSEANQEGCEALKVYVEGLTDEAFDMPVTNVTATWKQVGTSETYFCQVTGWIWPEIKFQVTLPTNWNERYINNGGGGWDGGLGVPNSPNAQGYATSSANGGYMSANWPSGAGVFGLKEPYFSEYYDPALYPTGAGGYYGSVDPMASGNPYACQKVYDYGIRHLRETPLIAKKIINRYYGSYPEYSYFSGGSNGGKEGMISAQKLYYIYDGFYIGCPLGGMVAVTFRGTWDTLWGAGLAQKADPSCTGFACPSVYSQYKAALHYKNVYDKCDGVDGLVDGLIDDPRNCNFDALTDLPACSPEEEALEAAGIYSSTCFTLAQRRALKEIYAGPHNSHGKAWYVGQPLGAEYLARGFGGGVSSGFGSALSDGMAPGMFANIALDPPDGPNFDITTFDWDKDPKAIQKTKCVQCYGDGTCETFNVHDVLDAITLSPNPAPNMGGLGPLYKKGGKIIQHHGWADSLVSALGGSSRFYETVMKKMGVEQTKSFYKLYLIPGAGHCGGGIGCYPTTGFQALVDWVETNKEPGALLGSRAANVDKNPYYNWPAARTRPVCPYPEVARWDGSGDIEVAESFMCVPPVEVRIEPEVLKLKKKGEFVAFITVPHDYRMEDWDLHDITCEGAPAKYGFAHGNVYYARFRTQDLQNVTPGNAVTLTVKGAFQKDGKEALVQGSDTVRVIK
jgi:feruloyl esterase